MNKLVFTHSNLTVYDICNSLPWRPVQKVAEVGVWKADECRSNEFILNNCHVDLFEPHPSAHNSLVAKYGKGPENNCYVHKVAIGSTNGMVKFYQKGSSSFLAGLDSPAIIDQKYVPQESDSFEVEMKTFDNYDKGDYDLVMIDTEGAEWDVMQTMRSRPRVLAVETHFENAYVNPRIKEINAWANQNGYKVLFKTRSDTFFYRDGYDYGGQNNDWVC